jgi:anti-sigma B factor antagonist
MLGTDHRQGERRRVHRGPVAFGVLVFAPVSGAALSATNAITVERRRIGDRAILSVGGEVDLATAPHLRSAIDAVLDSGARELCVDLGATTFMDSSGLNVLFDSQVRAEALQRRLAIVCPTGSVRRLFEVTGFADRLPLFDDLATAHA